MKTSPNILFIMADQMAAPLLPLHDPRSVLRMPHLSSLAERAVVFDSAYCNSPLCAPSRFTLVSGRLPTRIGAWDNAADFAADTPPTPTTCATSAIARRCRARCTSAVPTSCTATRNA